MLLIHGINHWYTQNDQPWYIDLYPHTYIYVYIYTNINSWVFVFLLRMFVLERVHMGWWDAALQTSCSQCDHRFAGPRAVHRASSREALAHRAVDILQSRECCVEFFWWTIFSKTSSIGWWDHNIHVGTSPGPRNSSLAQTQTMAIDAISNHAPMLICTLKIFQTHLYEIQDISDPRYFKLMSRNFKLNIFHDSSRYSKFAQKQGIIFRNTPTIQHENPRRVWMISQRVPNIWSVLGLSLKIVAGLVPVYIHVRGSSKGDDPVSIHQS